MGNHEHFLDGPDRGGGGGPAHCASNPGALAAGEDRAAGRRGLCPRGALLWCEQNRVDFVFGLARNARLETRVAAALQEARTMAEATGRPARVFRDFLWSTKETWSRRRRVIAPAH